MAQIPTPLRAALGLVANAIDGARTLPDKAVELPVLAVSTALQFSLRAQQRYAELTMRGDEVISRLRGLPEEPPSWATFDDEGAEAEPEPEPEPAESAAPATIGVDDAGPTPQSAAKRPRARPAGAKKAAAGGKGQPKARAKNVTTPRTARPSAFDAVGDPGPASDNT